MTTIAAKKKLNRADYMFADKTGEELVKKPGQVNGLDFQIRNLTDCKVFLLDTTAQVSRYIRRGDRYLPGIKILVVLDHGRQLQEYRLRYWPS